MYFPYVRLRDFCPARALRLRLERQRPVSPDRAIRRPHVHHHAYGDGHTNSDRHRYDHGDFPTDGFGHLHVDRDTGAGPYMDFHFHGHHNGNGHDNGDPHIDSKAASNCHDGSKGPVGVCNGYAANEHSAGLKTC